MTYSDELPEFAKRKKHEVNKLLTSVFGIENMVKLDEFEDHHFRVLFKPEFFILNPDATEPSKSQWNTLKKKLKRRDRQLFIFKQYGDILHDGEQAYYLDFGFFLD